jgi:cutinase
LRRSSFASSFSPEYLVADLSQAGFTFGDPLQDQAFQGLPAASAKVFCAQGDQVCNNAFIISAAHLSYGRTSVMPAAQFIAGQMTRA